MKAEMYVVTHKKAKIPKIAGYTPILVGAENKSDLAKEFYITDNQGENISSKNANYCELTAYYWIWKNSDADIVGISHYRRYFTKSRLSMKAECFADAKTMKDWIANYDIVVPVHFNYEKTIIDAVNTAPNIDDMKELERAIRIVHPDYLDDYNVFIHGYSSYLYNMCVMKKAMFDSYCDWLFKLLFFIEGEYDISNRSQYEQRIYGFLAERLLGVWILHNIDKTKVKEVRVIRSDEGLLRTIRHEIKNLYRELLIMIVHRKSNIK